MARVEGGAVTILVTWPELKDQINTRNLNFRFEEDNIAYEVFAIDGQYFYTTTIYKSGKAPDNQATYDAYRADFETNYKNKITDITSTQPFYLSNVDGYSITLKDGAAPTANDGYGIAVIGYDGSNYRMLKSDSSGRPVLVGAGTAGTPAGGILSIQGVAGGVSLNATTTPGSDITNSGTFTATSQTQQFLITDGRSSITWQITGTWTGTINFEKSLNGSTWESMSHFSGANGVVSTTANGTFFSSLGATQYVRLRTSAAWTGTANWNYAVGFGVKAIQLIDSIPTGANTIGAVTGSGTFTVNASATVGIVDNAAFTDGTTRVQPAGFIFDETAGTALTENDGGAARIDSKRSQVITIEDFTTRGQRLTITAANAMKIDGSAVTQPISAASLPLPTGAATETTLGTRLADATFTARINTLGQKTSANSTPIVIASDQSAIPITGSITATNPSVGSNNSAIPTSSTQIGGSDGTNLQPVRVFDLDSGGGQQWVLGVGLRKESGGGSVEAGTSTDPIRIDPTGTTTQPVSGTVTANQGGAWTVAATQSGTWTVQPGNTANTTPWLTTISQGGNAATVTASNALKIDGSAVTQPVSGTITANAGTGNFTVVQATAANLRAQTASESATGSAIPSIASLTGGSDGTNLRSLFVDTSGRLIIIGAAASGAAVAGNPVLIAGSDGTNARSIRTASDGTVRIDPTGTTTQPISGTVAATQSGTWNITNISGTISLPTGAATETTLGTRLADATFTARINTLGQKTMANSTPIVISSDQTVIPVSDNGGTLTVDNSTLSVVGGGTEATALRVTIANNSTGVVSVDDNGGALTVDGTVTANQGTAASLANAWSTKITDATNGPVAVKAASTIPLAADPALVVVLSPNQPAIPVTTAPSTSTPNLATGDIVLSSVTTTSIRRTTYTEQTTNFTGSIASASANDTSAGTGARTVRIFWVNATGTTKGTEDVTLNGTTGVNLVTSTKCFIEKIEVLTAGSGGVNAGIISLYTNVNKTGTVVGTIAVGDNTTFWAHHYVITGEICNVTGIYHGNNSTVSGGTSVAVLREKDLTASANVERQVSDFVGVAGAANPFNRIYGSVIQVAGPSRLVMYVTTSSASTVTYRGSFDSYDV